jgi:geranylgeranyl diphosphate synthase type I
MINATPRALRVHAEIIERFLRDHAIAPDSLIGRMAGYHMGWLDDHGNEVHSKSGKYLRPSLCLLAAQACGGEVRTALPAAAAIELVHNFTLIHDDIQDGDRLRRGRPTVWSIWGTAQAINAGDALHALAFGIVADGSGDSERAAAISSLISKALLRVIDGQSLDLSLEGQASTSPLTYLRLVRLKTGALIGAAMEAGAVSAGAAAPERAVFRRAGQLLGVAFQLRDDWLGVWGLAAQTGKSNQSDLARHKLTFPVVAGYAAATPAQRLLLDALLGDPSPTASERVRELLEELGGPELTADAARRPAQKALSILATCRLHPSVVKEFSYVADFIAERNN